MRILTVGNMYPPHHLGGYELLWQAGVRALREAGHEVTVLTTTFRHPGAGDEHDPAVVRELEWYWADHDFPKRTAAEVLALERHNAAVLARHRADADVISWWGMGGMSMSLIERVRRAGQPAIGWVIDDWLLYGPDVDGWLKLTRHIPRRLAELVTGIPARVDLERAARWIFCSESIRTWAFEKLRPANCDVVLPGVAPDFRPAPERDWQDVLLCPGRLDLRKGLLTAIDALAELPGQRLRLVGDGDAEARAAVVERARERGVAARLEMLPGVPRPELACIYADCDAVVFPVEWWEPFGLVPLEAMATGRPVIATGRGGSGEYLSDGENALLFEPGEAAALAEAVRRLAAEPALRRRLREGGFATAGRLTEAAWTNAVVREHEQLLARSQSPPGPAERSASSASTLG
jgi:glycogen synthase